jgi:hypothetical protein
LNLLDKVWLEVTGKALVPSECGWHAGRRFVSNYRHRLLFRRPPAISFPTAAIMGKLDKAIEQLFDNFPPKGSM